MNTVKKKKGKGVLIVVLIIIFAFIALTVVLSTTLGGETQPKEKKSILAEAMNLSAGQETEIINTLTQCGAGEITRATLFQTGEGHTSYHLDDKETQMHAGADYRIVVWVNDDKTIESVNFHDEDIYIDGKVVAKITDYYIQETACDNYRVAAQMLINQFLEYSETAKYENKSGWRFGVLDGYDVCQSTVTAKNALGASNKMDFQIKFERSTGNAVSLVLDGKEYL